MSDITTDIAVEAPPEAVAPAEAPSFADDLPEVPDQPVFDRGYVVKLREEAARHRTELRELQTKHSAFDEVYAGYEPDDVATWLDLARTWSQNPSAAAEMMRDIAQAVLAEGGTPEEAVAAAEAVAEEASDRPLTAADVDRLVSERLAAVEAEHAMQAAIQGIHQQVKDLGFEPDSMMGTMLMWVAHNQTGGDLTAAKASLDQHNQSIIDSYLQTKQPGYKVLNSPVAGAGTGTVEPPKTVAEAGKSAHAFWEAQRRG